MADEQSPTKPLTHKQNLFVSYYCGEARFNATKAAILAGYSEKSAAYIGHDLKKNPVIRARIDEILEAQTINSTEILQELTDVAMRSLDDCSFIVGYDREGNPVAAKMDANAKMKALELLGKNRALFTDRLNIDGDLGITYEIVGVDTEDLG